MASKAPKQWKLTEDETFSSFTSWQHNLLYTLSQDPLFKPFLEPEATWAKLTAGNPTRDLVADTEGPVIARLTAAQKAANLTQMLGLISQWVPHYLASDITKSTTSMEGIWHSIRKYYGFQQSEAQFIKFSTISWEEGERPERLYQRLLAHLQDNLLKKDSKLRHDGKAVGADEDISPTVERLAVLRWMELIHPGLPALVQRTFAYDLQRMTLKDMQPQIVDALDGFLEELRGEEIKANRVFHAPTRQGQKSSQRRQPPRQFNRPPRKECRLCKAEGRNFIGHNIGQCNYLTHSDKQSIQAHRIDIDDQCGDEQDIVDEIEDMSLEEME